MYVMKMLSLIRYRIIIFDFPIQPNNQGKRMKHILETSQLKLKNLSKSLCTRKRIDFCSSFCPSARDLKPQGAYYQRSQ